MYDYQRIIDKYYPAGSPLRDIYMRHCRSVANLALDIARRKGLDLSPADIEAAAMLHDIGIVRTDAPGIHCHGSEPYLAHGRIGADLLAGQVRRGCIGAFRAPSPGIWLKAALGLTHVLTIRWQIPN